MALEGEYQDSPVAWVRGHVDQIERNGTTDGTTIRGLPVIVMTSRGAKSGKLRKVPLMRVEHDGVYAVVASVGGAPRHPLWYHNVLAHPQVDLQDGTEHSDRVAREVTGEEKATWWKRAVAAFGDYETYQAGTERQIPVFVLEPVTP